jgi:bifunctional non-homologous end joining protein LigD
MTELPGFLSPMLATMGTPPVGAGWAYEFKWDGVRAVIATSGDGWRAHSRNGNEITHGYPELRVLPELVGGRTLVLDGEIVTLDAGGRPDFGLLQHRMHLRHPSAEVMAAAPVLFYAFDLLVLDGEKVTAQPWTERRALLNGLDVDGGVVRVPPSVDGLPPAQILEVAKLHGLEGIVAKRAASRYEVGRRSPAWVKTALSQNQEVLVIGWRPGKGRRTNGVGSLLLAAHRDGELAYIGDVGTGFTDKALAVLGERLATIGTPGPAVDGIPRDFTRDAVWVEPVLVGEVEFRRWTHDGKVRHAAWRGLRPDKDPADVIAPAIGS